MHNILKPLLLTSLMMLPCVGAASASPIWASHEDPAVLREQLRNHQMSYETAMSNRNFDRARYESDQMDITQSKIAEAEFAQRWDVENSEDYHLMMDPNSYYSRRTVITTTPGINRVYDPITETYHYIRINP
ncbi:hypothetical protein JST97_04625 [bacterium]|nr:hypothetical protein [bacterium]